MFYQNLELPSNEIERDFFLIDNFLKNVPTVVNHLADAFRDNAQNEINPVNPVPIKNSVNPVNPVPENRCDNRCLKRL